jgi:hypothetical protein
MPVLVFLVLVFLVHAMPVLVFCVLALRGTTLRVVMRVADQRKSNRWGDALDRVARSEALRLHGASSAHAIMLANRMLEYAMPVLAF